MSQTDYPMGTRPGRIDVDTTVVTPTDRVRWGAVLAGLFAALSTMALLSVLGLAIGFSSVDAGDQVSDFGIGAGIWGAIVALAAFFFGGWMAAKTAAVAGNTNGVLQGAMVWMVAIAVLLYLIAGGVGAMFRTAGSVAATSAQIAGDAATAASNSPDVRNRVDPAAATQAVTTEAKKAYNTIKETITPQRVENVAERAGGAAWGTLISMVLGLGAAAVGGFLGARTPIATRERVS